MGITVNNIRSQPPWILAAILLTTLIPLYVLSYQYHLRYPYGISSSTTNHQSKNKFPPTHPAFEKKWLQTPLIDNYNPSALRRYCNHTPTWRPSLVFNLADANGGIGNIRGNFLDFIFYAIEVGASTLVLPTMASRDDEDLFNVWHGNQPLSTFFEERWFVEKLGESCPQMKVVKEIPRGEGVVEAKEWFMPKYQRLDMSEEDTRESLVEQLEEFVREQTGQELEIWDQEAKGKGGKKVVVNMGRTLWNFDTFGLPWNLRREFPQLLRMREDVVKFAAEVVKNLALEFGLDIDATDRMHKGYFGAHLRTEQDAVQANFLVPGTEQETQMKALIESAHKHHLSTLYVASGSASELALFRHACSLARPPLNVTSKFDLLSSSSASALRKLRWDQQALVDLKVLEKAEFIQGMMYSSFSWQLVMSRQLYVMEELGRVGDGYSVGEREENVAFDDGFSRIMGVNWEGTWARIPRGNWP